MKRLVTVGLLAVAALVGGVSTASGQSDRAIERSGNTFHVAACGRPAKADVARYDRLLMKKLAMAAIAAMPMLLAAHRGVEVPYGTP